MWAHAVGALASHVARGPLRPGDTAIILRDDGSGAYLMHGKDGAGTV